MSVSFDELIDTRHEFGEVAFVESGTANRERLAILVLAELGEGGFAFPNLLLAPFVDIAL